MKKSYRLGSDGFFSNGTFFNLVENKTNVELKLRVVRENETNINLRMCIYLLDGFFKDT